MKSKKTLFINKKSFTLLEVLISITLFMIMVLFLYKTLDQTKHSNNLFAKKEQSVKEINTLYKIFLEDIAEAISVKIDYDRDSNAIVRLVTDNTYHDAYKRNVTYLVSSNDMLVRIESYNEFKMADTSYDFYENNSSYIDTMLNDIEFFDTQENSRKDEYVFAIKQKNKDRILFKTFKIKPNIQTPPGQGN